MRPSRYPWHAPSFLNGMCAVCRKRPRDHQHPRYPSMCKSCRDSRIGIADPKATGWTHAPDPLTKVITPRVDEHTNLAHLTPEEQIRAVASKYSPVVQSLNDPKRKANLLHGEEVAKILALVEQGKMSKEEAKIRLVDIGERKLREQT